MGYNTATTEWPNGKDLEDFKPLIDKFFSLLDDKGDAVGDQLADDIFTSDGELAAPAGKASGSAEIRTCRKNAWNLVVQRKHSVRRVYRHNDETDLMLIGDVSMVLANGAKLDGDFAARIVLARVATGEARIKLYQVWADSAPVQAALKNN
ncbi:hypothetical protein IQ07DRAFT_647307 [Pyrenochaeta sp. DS3sAY3a]|nr:hypothetical protein IQ07DRAFT_647307 [Pyrenochaeta sp. DS3sAY3a]